MLNAREKSFFETQRVARLATADGRGVPHVVPVCFAIDGATLYITVDEKPKRPGGDLKRLRNIRENASVAIIADRYDEDWTRLAWVMLRGKAEILAPNGPAAADHAAEHARAQAHLKARYPQYVRMSLSELSVIAVRIERVASWGDLET